MKKVILIAIIGLVSLTTSYSQTEAITNDGRIVSLNEDGTYAWIETKNKTETVKETNGGDYFVAKHIDDMTDKVYYYSSTKLFCQDTSLDLGFSVSFNYEGKTDDKVKVDGLTVKAIGLECLENTELLFLFDDNTKLSLKNWNKFNCKGNAWYSLTSSQKQQLASKTIKKVRIENGRNYKSYTHELEGEDKNYFINMNKSVESKDIRKQQFQ